ncbi:hypothetical protein GGX14DRAFT_440819 [Mycena pura]|uniref:Uncharacterized protein n=1 Tax=Mycena pura TaxID=153505 RepID=A0AAD6VMF6_9AGAR|nr:hypothetical protein GGX14DRAFT_440818 [Mycena pura]KAJ7217251.1 hypothetical protein GGX14DRAFT_440819 [Mycena pura]
MEIPDPEAASTSEPAQATTNRDPLSWLDDGLPDLRTSPTDYFELTQNFDITQYLHILASGVGKSTEAGNKKIDETEDTGSDSKAAA